MSIQTSFRSIISQSESSAGGSGSSVWSMAADEDECLTLTCLVPCLRFKYEICDLSMTEVLVKGLRGRFWEGHFAVADDVSGVKTAFMWQWNDIDNILTWAESLYVYGCRRSHFYIRDNNVWGGPWLFQLLEPTYNLSICIKWVSSLKLKLYC